MQTETTGEATYERVIPVWPSNSSDEWTSVRERVRVSGTMWNDEVGASVSVLRDQLLDGPRRSGSYGERLLDSVAATLNFWFDLPQRSRQRVYIGLTVAVIALYLVLLANS